MSSDEHPVNFTCMKVIHKGTQKWYRYDGICPGNSAHNVTHQSDPRLLSKRSAFRGENLDLPVPKFIIDENYVGQPPLRELAFFDLNDNVNENFLTDMCKKFGTLEEVKIFYHPTTKRHLGIARVVYESQREAAACVERYKTNAIMGKKAIVLTDPCGRLVKEATEKAINKNQNHNSTVDQGASTPSIVSQIPASSSAAPSVKTKGQIPFSTSSKVTSSPAIHAQQPPAPAATPGLNGNVPDDPSSQIYPGYGPYGAYPSYPSAYSVTQWPATGQPHQWPPATTPWPPWPVTYTIPPPVDPPAPGVGEDVTVNVKVEESLCDKALSSRPSSKLSGRKRDSSHEEENERRHSMDQRKRKEQPSSDKKQPTISPESRSHSCNDRSSKSKDCKLRRNLTSSPLPSVYSKRYVNRRNDDVKRHRSQDRNHRSASASRRPRSGHRNSRSDSEDDSKRGRRKKEHTLESEEEYYRRSKLSCSQHRPTSRSSNGRSSAAALSRGGSESRRSVGSGYCDEIEEYEYYCRKRRRIVPRSSAPKNQHSSTKPTGAHHQLHEKFEAITSSEEDDGHPKPKGASVVSKKKPSSSSNITKVSTTPFGKLERISCSSEENTDREMKDRWKKNGPKQHSDDRRGKVKYMPAKRSKHRSRSRRSASTSSSSDSSSRTSYSSSRSSEYRTRRRRYRKQHEDRKEIRAVIKKRTQEKKHISPRRDPVSDEKKPSMEERTTTTTTTAAAASATPGSLDKRIQQLLGGEQFQNGCVVDEISTPLHDEHTSSTKSKVEKTSDVEMSLSSGDEGQGTPNPPPPGMSNSLKGMTPAVAKMPINYTDPNMAAAAYYHPVYMYPGYTSHMAPMIPHQPYAMWPQQPVYHNHAPEARIPGQPLSRMPMSTKPQRDQAKTGDNAKSLSFDELTKRSVLEVKLALRAVLRKDVVKRAVEASVFSSVDAWFEKEEAEFNSKTSVNETLRSSYISSQPTLPPILSQPALVNLFDSYSSSSALPSSLIGVPGLGLRASLPKLPSFKIKRMRPPTPTSSTPGREEQSESSESSSESESEEDTKSEQSTDSKEVAKQRSRRRVRTSESSTRSISSSTSNSRSVSRESECSRMAPPTSTPVKRVVIDSDVEEERMKASQHLDIRRALEEHMEPISDDEIEDEPNDVQQADSSVEDEEIIGPRMNSNKKKKIISDDDDDSIKQQAKVTDGQMNVTDENMDKENSDTTAPKSESTTKNRIPAAGRKRRGKVRVETTTDDDEAIALENANTATRSKVPIPSWIPQPITDNDLVQKQEVDSGYPDGVMFVGENCEYHPNQFDHFYTTRIAETAASGPIGVSGTAILKPKGEANIADSKKPKASQKAAEPSKPARPAITFKRRADADDRRLLYEFLKVGIDEEDIGYLKSACDDLTSSGHALSTHLQWAPHVATAEPAFKKRRLQPDEIPAHASGCARTEGFYRLSHKDKRRISKPRQALDYTDVQAQQNVNSGKQHLQLNREARSMQRRLLATLGSEVDSDLLKYNQLRFRKKQIKFSRSHIHGWGLFSMEDIAQDEMIVEYVGEKVRYTVAEKREKKYEKMGVGSSYLFRIDNEMVIDATKRGNIARFINHSCNPNCYARIITVEGEKRIVIYSKQSIQRGDEITYDYKFPLEDEKIPCNCGAPCCRGSLN